MGVDVAIISRRELTEERLIMAIETSAADRRWVSA
jgi:hypothetical protein